MPNSVHYFHLNDRVRVDYPPSTQHGCTGVIVAIDGAMIRLLVDGLGCEMSFHHSELLLIRAI